MQCELHGESRVGDVETWRLGRRGRVLTPTGQTTNRIGKMYARVTCWWTILRIALEERLVYRGDFALGTLMRFLPIVTQIFLWWAVFETISDGIADGGDNRWLFVSQRGGVLPADDGQPSVFEHARIGVGHRAADSQRRDQEVPDPADRHARLPAAEPHRAQAGLLFGGHASVCIRFLSVPRLLRGRLARLGHRCSVFC